MRGSDNGWSREKGNSLERQGGRKVPYRQRAQRPTRPGPGMTANRKETSLEGIKLLL